MEKIVKVLFGLQVFKVVSLLILTAFILFSCTPEEQMARLVKNHPDLIKTNITDKEDSTEKVTKEVKKGGSTSMEIPDSLLNKATKEKPLEKDSSGVKTFIYHHNNTTYVHSDCPPDTVIRDTKEIHHWHTTIKYYPLLEKPKEKKHWYTDFLFMIYGAGIAFLVTTVNSLRRFFIK